MPARMRSGCTNRRNDIDVAVLPDGTIVATTYGHWVKGEPPYIVSVRLKLAELDARAR